MGGFPNLDAGLTAVERPIAQSQMRGCLDQEMGSGILLGTGL